MFLGQWAVLLENIIKEKCRGEYSVVKPATNSDSASVKSKGTLLDSPKREGEKKG